MKRAAIQLSMNFIVTIIIALVVFGFGLRFVYTLFSDSGDIQDITLEDIDRQIADLQCARTEKVCLDRDTFVLSPKDLEVVSTKVLNIDTNENVRIELSKGIYLDANNNDFPVSENTLNYKPSEYIEVIKNNEEKTVGFAFEIPEEGAKKGTYVFDLNVYKQLGNSEEKYDKTHKIYVKVN